MVAQTRRLEYTSTCTQNDIILPSDGARTPAGHLGSHAERRSFWPFVVLPASRSP